jgi:transcriptional regulator with XRE-family HTH domain
MGTRPVEQGETGRHVAAEIRRLRTKYRWTLREVSAALEDAGRPLLPSGISKIEDGERRVDVDDLVAFAQVFGVSPHELLGWTPPASAPAEADTQQAVEAAVRRFLERPEIGQVLARTADMTAKFTELARDRGYDTGGSDFLDRLHVDYGSDRTMASLVAQWERENFEAGHAHLPAENRKTAPRG